MGAPLAALQINAPEVVPQGLDCGDLTVFGAVCFERLGAVEGEAAVLRSGIGEDNLNPFGRGSDLLDFGVTSQSAAFSTAEDPPAPLLVSSKLNVFKFKFLPLRLWKIPCTVKARRLSSRLRIIVS